jgi:hypothetical protein
VADEPAAVAPLRRALTWIAVVGFVGTAADLLLLQHYEDPWQWAPLAIAATATVALAAQVLRPGTTSLMMTRSVMIASVVAALVGVWLHYRGSMEFQLETDPSLGGLDLLLKVLRSKAPPTMAPFNLAVLGLVGLASTYRQRA